MSRHGFGRVVTGAQMGGNSPVRILVRDDAVFFLRHWHRRPSHRISRSRRLRNQRASAFWLGPIQDARYATEDLTPGQITITYIQHGTSLYDLADPKRTIQTFNDIAAFRDMGYAFRDSNTLVTTTMKLGRTVIFDSSVMNTEIVLFSNDPEVVVITYVHPKQKSELISNADSLRTVW